MDIVKGKIGNALTSAASNHVVATTNDIYDESIGKYQNVLNNDLQGIVENAALINGLQLDTKQSDPNYLGIIYTCYVNRDNMLNGTIELPLATSNNAGLISHELYSKITDFLTASPVIDDFNIVVGDTPDDIRFCYMYLDTDGTYKSNSIPIPLATTTNGGLMGKWEYNYVHTLLKMQLLSGIIKVTALEDNVSLNYEVQHHGKQTLVIPKATLQSAGVISKEDYVALRTLIDNSSSTDSPYGEYPLMLGQSITFENVNGSLNMKWMAISPGGEPYNNTAIIPTVNNNCSGLMSSSSYLHLNNLLDAHLVKDVNVISTYKANESDATTQAAIEITKYSSITPTKTTIPLPVATSTSSGAMTPNQVAFIDYHQGHNTYDDFADIPVDKHICIVNLNYTTGEGENSKALTVVMDGVGKYDGAEVLLYCNHNGSANLSIGTPANSTNGAEYVLIANDGQQYIFIGTQELDFVLSCTYINNKWYVKKL